jgi:hypothetical protein
MPILLTAPPDESKNRSLAKTRRVELSRVLRKAFPLICVPLIGYEVVLNIFLILLLVLDGISIGILLFSFVMFTRLVRILHDHYPDEWLHAG